MKEYIRYISVLIVVLAALTGCSIDGLNPVEQLRPDSDAVTVIGRMTRFDDRDVSTRGVKDQDEAKLTSMAMAIFKVKADGSGLDGDCVHYQFADNQAELLFTIERGSNYAYNTRYVMYVFTNMPGMSRFGVGSTLEEMMAAVYNVQDVDIPSNGFPMMGSLGDTFSTTFDNDGKNFVLSPTQNGDLVAPTVDGTTQTLLTIPMRAMYAKINFTIEVRPDMQIDGNYSPQFIMEDCTVNNVPSTVDFSNASNSDTEVLDGSFSPQVTGNTVASGANKIDFSFYLPERLLAPATEWDDYEYPFGKGDAIRNEDLIYRQRYKPRLLDDEQKATNVVISGRFRDHQNHWWNLDYTIYLGEDNFGDFNIRRNCEYNNVMTIRGIESSDDMTDDGHTISIDHRVNIERTQPAIITLRREVMLDSHFEIRPLRVRKSDVEESDINAVKVEVVDPETTNWMRLERSFGDGTPENSPETMVNGTKTSIYVEDANSSSYGKRKFFTYNLIDGVNANTTDASLVNSTSVILPLTDETECCWIYVDECSEAGDDVRAGVIKVSYGSIDAGGNFTPANNATYPDVNYVINQRKLFPVDKDGRSYNIEYFEEYLYNYDSDDSFGQTEYEGMEWGLYNDQLSYKYPAVYVDLTGGLLSWLDDLGWDFDDMMNGLVNSVKPYYDFYLTRDKTDNSLTEDSDYNDDTYDGIIIRDYSGYSFCNDIIQVMNGYDGHNTDKTDDINVLSLAEEPKSAVEYCYNKNKRNNKGEVVWQEGNNNYNQSQLNWYLPAIDEIEDIVTSRYGNGLNTYARFLEFQDKFYWSSQPAYYYNKLTFELFIQIFIKISLGKAEGKLFEDNIGNIVNGIPGYARATKVEYMNGNYQPAKSSIDGASNNVYIEYYNSLGTPQYTSVSPAPTFQSGYKSRNSMARVRCVRKMN